MIRMIVAIDDKLGLANDHGIPWMGKLPTDIQYFRQKTTDGNVLMGLVTYKEFDRPLSRRRNYVINDTDEKMRPGFEEVRDLHGFVKSFSEDLWIIGGAGVFAQTIQYADELYLTRVGGDFNCTKFFPEFENEFEQASSTETQKENDIPFRFEVWKRKS